MFAEPGEPSLAEQLQREHDAIRAQYHGTPQWLKAPNGKPSNLNEHQWVQVRTPRFKAWFGDWELAAQKLRPADNFSQARAAAKVFQGQPLTSLDNVKASVSRNNLDKMLSASAVHKSESSAEHALAVANLDTLFRAARTGWTKTDRDGNENIQSVRRMFAPMRVGNQIRLVKLTVKEFAQASHGHRIYSVESIEVGSASPVPEMVDADRANGSRLLTGPTGLVDDLITAIRDFNVNGASQVTDANGEPMVMYRMSNFDPEAATGHTYWASNPAVANTYMKHYPELQYRGMTAYIRAIDVIDAGGAHTHKRAGHEAIWRAEDIGSITQQAVLVQNIADPNFSVTARARAKGRFLGHVAIVPMTAKASVKSATGNTGEYDQKNSVITKSLPRTTSIRLTRI